MKSVSYDLIGDLHGEAAVLRDLLTPRHDDRLPIFIGHYWLPPKRPAPLTPTIACLDYSVAGGGPLVAYRWDGEQHLLPEKFVFDFKRTWLPENCLTCGQG